MNNIEKQIKIMELLTDIDDRVVKKFFDLDSEKMLDEKIEVLTQLVKGKNPEDIKNYYKILELLPKDNEIWD